ncbi:glycosyltransferase [Microbacterium sulfonylureivorans]|uniref:glycosyltransferase n=1 Tax=Microbacterium sulfonylureivorans TaxID=2486854 RepID=UPI001F0BF369|nr:glycosyltransferase [Microbacterium sulfonylureivorans]
MTVALAHDYVTQRGGAERVALAMTRAFPGAALHTTLYDPAGTFPEFAAVDIRTMPINRWGLLRRHHRLALPFLAKAVSAHRVDADVLLASSSGWAHGIPVTGRKIVYCHAPARWLYQSDRYAGAQDAGMRARAVGAAIRVLGPGLRDWDQAAARSADRYLVNSTVVQAAVRDVYGIEAEVLAPPPAPIAAEGAVEPVEQVTAPFLLCVARLLPYKNVDVVIEAVTAVGGVELVIVGDGPERNRLAELARRSGRTHLLGRVSDAQLKWLYAHSAGLVAASYEDFGLSPLEAGSFGKPTAALRDGGYLDTVIENTNGVFFDSADAAAISAAVERMLRARWSERAIRKHAAGFSEERFAARLAAVVAEEAARV